jgi:transposase
MTNSTDIFQMALGLESPFKVKEVSLKIDNQSQKRLDIYIGFDKGSKFKDDTGVLCSVHDTLERTWRHLNFFEHECYLHCNVPRIVTSEGKVRQVSVSWARENSGFTLLFEAFSMHLIESEMPVNKVGATVKEYPNRIWTIFNYWIREAYSEAEHSSIKKVGIDETSSKKGHNYVSIGVNLEEHSVFFATEGKDATTIEKMKDYLEEKGCPKEQIEQVSIDLSPAFIEGTLNNFPNANITFDRFHIKKLLNEAMNDVRKSERKEHEELKGKKYLFLKNNTNLSKKQRQERGEFITLYPILGETYRLKELFDDFWNFTDKDEAAAFLSYWSDLVYDSGIQPLIKFANTVKAHWSGIINFIQTRITNGILESINAKVQLAKKRARGYRNIKNFINMIYFIASKLKFNYPRLST